MSDKKITVFPSRVDCDLYLDKGWKASISIGREYYETDRYKDKQSAVAEAYGWWEGTKRQVDKFFELNKEDKYELHDS